MEKKIGIIDLGSNSVRLVIYEIRSNGTYKLIDDISDTIRLSEKMVEGKYLNDIAMRRAVKTIRLFKKLCQAYRIPPRNIIAVATEAVRKAENRDVFLSLLSRTAGVDFQVLSGEMEARFVYHAVIRSIDLKDGLVVDIGGGSTEIIHVKEGKLNEAISIPIGAVVATEQFLGNGGTPQEKAAKLEKHLAAKLKKLKWLTGAQCPVIVGLGGTLRNLARIHKKKTGYPVELTHNYRMEIREFEEIYDELKLMDLEDRKRVKGLSPKRADIIVGGLAILKALAGITPARQLVISGDGLREGILQDFLQKQQSSASSPDVLDSSIRNCMAIYDVRRKHAEHVCKLALSLFDQLEPLHRLGENERKLLQTAAMLHDIGIAINYYGHYAHSFYMILNTRLNGLTHREIVLTAAIAASHGKDKLKEDWETQYSSILLASDMASYQKLSLILRIAEGLDRSETGIVKAVRCLIGGEAVHLETICKEDGELEISVAGENGDSFRKVFQKQLLIT